MKKKMLIYTSTKDLCKNFMFSVYYHIFSRFLVSLRKDSEYYKNAAIILLLGQNF